MPDSMLDLSFPKGGVDLSSGFSRQKPRLLPNGEYSRSTAVGTNVRAYEPTTDRCRGGSRPGLSRYINAIPGGTAGLIQCLEVVVGTGYTSPSGSPQSSQSNRLVNLVVVIGGTVYVTDAGGTSWTTATNDTGTSPALASTGIIRTAVNNQRVYFFDGTHRCYYEPSTNRVKAWTASAGTFPSNSAVTAFPRLGCNWRGALLTAGLESDPQNWFLTAMATDGGVAADFDYAPDSPSPTQAVAGNNSDLGLVGDIITAVIPYSNDRAIFGCDHELWMMSGHPADGGTLDPITKQVGMAWGNAWVQDPYGVLWFFSNTREVYRMAPGQLPIPVSQPIDGELRNINTGTHAVRLAWNGARKELHVFVTKTSAAAVTTHYCFETRVGAWWFDTFADTNMDPLAITCLDGNESSDNVVLLGSRDGYVRALDNDAVKDDTKNIESEVLLGPIVSDSFDDMMAKEHQMELGEESEDVDYEILVGRTAEAALSSTAVQSGTFTAGRNHTMPVRRAAHAIYGKLSSTKQWSMERWRMVASTRGKVRARAKN